MENALLKVCILILQIRMLCSTKTLLQHTKAQGRFLLHTHQLTFKEAQAYCRNLGNHWDLPLGTEDLGDFMKNVEVKNSWLGIEKKKFKNWTWVDNTESMVPIVRDQGFYCAGVSTQGMKLRSMHCTERGNGFVCEIHGKSSCPLHYFSQNCFTIGKDLFVLGCFTQSWFDARSFCTANGGDLAILNTSAKQQAVLNYIIEKKYIDECSWVFAGLRLEDWFIGWNNSALFQSNWLSNQPHSEHSCAETDEKNHWRSTPCHQSNFVICQNYVDNENASQTRTDAGPQKTSANSHVWMGLFIVTLIILCLAASMQFLRHRLVFMGKNTVPAIPDCPDIANIVIFSSEKMSSAYREIKVFNIDWSKKSGAFHKNELTSPMVNVIAKGSKINQEDCKLQIVNIHSQDFRKEGKCFLPGDCLLDILQYLLDHKGTICAILLPEFARNIEFPKTVLSRLWDLRSKVVVISEATENPSIPADEVIAVGVHVYKAIRPSGNIDFAVNYSAFPDANTFGAAFVSGVAAAIWQQVLRELPGDRTKIMRRILLRKVQRENYPLEGFGILEVDENHSLNEVFFSKDFIMETYSNYEKEKQRFPPPSGITENGQAHSNTTHETIVKAPGEEIQGKIKIGILRPCDQENVTFFGKKVIIYGSHPVALNSYKDEEMRTLEKTFQLLKTTCEVKKYVEFVWYALMDGSWRINKEQFLKYKDDISLCNLLYFTTIAEPVEREIQEAVFELSRNCVVVTQAINQQHKCVPCGVPGASVIAIGRRHDDAERYEKEVLKIPGIKGKDVEKREPLIKKKKEENQKRQDADNVKCCGDQSCGSTLDFLCGFDFLEGEEVEGEEEAPKKAPNAATFQAVAVITSILAKAAALGVPENVQKHIATTQTMHAILRQMSSHPENHSIDEGWGELQPQLWLDNKNSDTFKALLQHCAHHNENKYWAGKNV